MNLTVEQINKVIDVLQKKIIGYDQFTAYDITESLRNDGEEVKHYEVKHFVHEYMEEQINDCDLEYSKTLKNICGNKNAFVYEPKPSLIKDNSILDSLTYLNVYLDSRYRLCVPAEVVKRHFGNVGDIAYIYVGDNMNLNIYPFEYSGSNCVAKYLVDKYFNIRISSKVLSYLKYETKYDITSDVSNNKISICASEE